MFFLDHVQNLHIHAETTHKDFGAHCMKYVNFVQLYMIQKNNTGRLCQLCDPFRSVSRSLRYENRPTCNCSTSTVDLTEKCMVLVL